MNEKFSINTAQKNFLLAVLCIQRAIWAIANIRIKCYDLDIIDNN